MQDDDARGLLGAIATAGLLKQERWHSTITTATLANLRAASKNGFGPSSGGFSTLVGADLSPVRKQRSCAKLLHWKGRPFVTLISHLVTDCTAGGRMAQGVRYPGLSQLLPTLRLVHLGRLSLGLPRQRFPTTA